MDLQGLQVLADFLPLDLGSTEIILGMAWLRTLGDMKVNWSLLTMEINVGPRTVQLIGEPGLCRTQVSVKAMARAVAKGGEFFLAYMHSSDTGPDDVTVEPPFPITRLLEEYRDIFCLPLGLPPPRDHEHSITLKNGTAPISVRPYRYPQAQKDEIERLVNEMLEAGIIQPSESFFESYFAGAEERRELAVLRRLPGTQ